MLSLIAFMAPVPWMLLETVNWHFFPCIKKILNVIEDKIKNKKKKQVIFNIRRTKKQYLQN